MAAQGVGEFVEVTVVERTPDRLPQLVLCDRVEVAVPHERGVVAVDHLAHQVRVRVPRANPISDLRPELRGHGVGGVEPPCRGTPVEPVVHHRGNVINYGRAGVVAGVVERDEVVVALEVVVVGQGPRVPGGGVSDQRSRNHDTVLATGPSSSTRRNAGWERPTWLKTPSSMIRNPRPAAASTRASKSASSPSRGSMRKWSVVS